MATANKEFNARIQLKHDTEANWQLVPTFVPYDGEMIIYTADSTHAYCRVKIGNGHTAISQLPFVDSGTVDGESTFIVKYDTFNDFPDPGSSKKLYIDLSTKDIYHYSGTQGYKKLLNFTLTIQTAVVSKITNFDPGRLTRATVESNVLIINNGLLPELTKQDLVVVSGVAKGENE